MDTVKNAEPKTIIIMIVIKIPMDHLNTYWSLSFERARREPF